MTCPGTDLRPCPTSSSTSTRAARCPQCTRAQNALDQDHGGYPVAGELPWQPTDAGVFVIDTPRVAMLTEMDFPPAA